ncbi:hypothetical protein EV356DRAFT_496335 [Viridothelium virens]|uniref:REJ domain-containing protein n=1 Tax=Viridothelium virens TaxID=1048519 RepID=A0A6A6GTX7_VIRVR|nr:hypothetical protein EV356DRAFT_496335 [Viridothelium virens]
MPSSLHFRQICALFFSLLLFFFSSFSSRSFSPSGLQLSLSPSSSFQARTPNAQNKDSSLHILQLLSSLPQRP